MNERTARNRCHDQNRSKFRRDFNLGSSIMCGFASALEPRYSHSILYECPCSMKTAPPRELKNYTLEELDALLGPSQKKAVHYFVRWGAYSTQLESYCPTCSGVSSKYYKF